MLVFILLPFTYDNTGTPITAGQTHITRPADIYAPGVNIYTTGPQNSHSFATGTSMAAAFMTGAAALYSGIVTNPTANQIKTAARHSARVLPTGNPALDITAMLEAYTDTEEWEYPDDYSWVSIPRIDSLRKL